jgi:hypothetical protein
MRAARVSKAPSFEEGVTRDDFMALFRVLREPGAGAARTQRPHRRATDDARWH